MAGPRRGLPSQAVAPQVRGEKVEDSGSHCMRVIERELGPDR